MVKMQFVKRIGSWRDVADASRTTVNMKEGSGEPKSSWKKRMLLAEHSPIRLLQFRFKWRDLPYWISTHFVRHKYGIEHFVSTQREDRCGVPRKDKPQGALVSHEVLLNAQAIINISKKRLCVTAHKETREAWLLFLNSLKETEPELYSVCVPTCISKGHCYEYESCGYHKTLKFNEELLKYQQGIN